MKKIISFLLLAAMLIGCMVPAVVVSAADATLTAESVEKVQGTGANVSPKITIANNPGIYYLKLVVYYDAAQLAQADAESALANSIFSADDSSVATEVKGTNNKIKNYIPEELRASSSGFVIEFYGAYDEDLGDTATVTADGIVIELPLSIITEELGAFNYNVVFVEATGVDGAEVELADVAGTITYAADPLVGIYDEFTVFANPANGDIELGTETLDVDIRFDNNPGLWAVRLFIVYPDCLTLNKDGVPNIENPYSIFPNPSDLFPGNPDVALDDPSQVAAFQKIIAEQGLVTEGYQSTTVYFELPGFDDFVDANGILATLHFDVAADIEAGEEIDIRFYYDPEADFLWAGTTPEGQPIFRSYTPDVYGADFTVVEKACAHTNTTEQTEEATCGADGSVKVVCSDCGATISETVIPATGSHTEGTAVIVPSTCTEAGTSTVSCTVCGKVLSETALDLAAHTPGAEPTCQAAQTCTVCGVELNPALAHVEGAPVVTNPTCVEDGKNVYNCTMCGEFIREESIPATGHLYLQPGNSTIVPPTCTEDGYTSRKCDVCGEESTTDPTPAYGHDEDGAQVVTKPATCIEEGELTIYCDFCGEVSKVVAIPVTDTHNLQHVAAAEAVCHQNGNVEYWYCVDCDAVYTDAEGKYLSNRKNVTIAAPVALAHVPAAEACHVAGTQEYWFCPECDAVFADAAGTQLTNRKNLEIAPDCELVYVPAAEPCHAAGSAEYWYCPECDAVFADAEGTIRTNRKNLEIAPDCELVHMDAVEPCHAAGIQEYWYCPECDAVYADEAGTQLTNRKNLEIAPVVELVYVPAAEACHVAGSAEFWYCPVCEAVYADEAGTQLTNRKNLEIAPDCELVHMDAVEPCHANGTYEYWFCPECEAVYADEAGTQLTNRMNLTIPADSEAVHTPAVDATCTENGMAEYWYCADCDTHFADAECKYPVAYLSLTIPATGHDYVDGECTVCGDKEAADDDKAPVTDDNKAPTTGDNMIVIVVALAVALMAGAALIVIRRKRSSN